MQRVLQKMAILRNKMMPVHHLYHPKLLRSQMGFPRITMLRRRRRQIHLITQYWVIGLVKLPLCMNTEQELRL